MSQLIIVAFGGDAIAAAACVLADLWCWDAKCLAHKGDPAPHIMDVDFLLCWPHCDIGGNCEGGRVWRDVCVGGGGMT